MPNEKSCCVICPVGIEGSDIRNRTNQLIRDVILPVLDEAEYSLYAAHQSDDPRNISVEIVEKILGADIVIADLTTLNPNVFYELAIRNAAELPSINLMHASQREYPFDITQIRYFEYDLEELGRVEETKRVLRRFIRRVELGEFRCEDPVSLARTVAGFQRILGRMRNDELKTITSFFLDSNLRSVKKFYEIKNQLYRLEWIIKNLGNGIEGESIDVQLADFMATYRYSRPSSADSIADVRRRFEERHRDSPPTQEEMVRYKLELFSLYEEFYDDYESQDSSRFR